MSILAEFYQGSDGHSYRVWRVDGVDDTPLHMTYPTGYDARCSHCWLGAAHSEAAHAAQIAKAER